MSMDVYIVSAKKVTCHVLSGILIARIKMRVSRDKQGDGVVAYMPISLNCHM